MSNINFGPTKAFIHLFSQLFLNGQPTLKIPNQIYPIDGVVLAVLERTVMPGRPSLHSPKGVLPANYPNVHQVALSTNH